MITTRAGRECKERRRGELEDRRKIRLIREDKGKNGTQKKDKKNEYRKKAE